MVIRIALWLYYIMVITYNRFIWILTKSLTVLFTLWLVIFLVSLWVFCHLLNSNDIVHYRVLEAHYPLRFRDAQITWLVGLQNQWPIVCRALPCAVGVRITLCTMLLVMICVYICQVAFNYFSFSHDKHVVVVAYK